MLTLIIFHLLIVTIASTLTSVTLTPLDITLSHSFNFWLPHTCSLEWKITDTLSEVIFLRTYFPMSSIHLSNRSWEELWLGRWSAEWPLGCYMFSSVQFSSWYDLVESNGDGVERMVVSPQSCHFPYHSFSNLSSEMSNCWQWTCSIAHLLQLLLLPIHPSSGLKGVDRHPPPLLL